jgi:Uma2 family endonuclease
MTFAARPSLNGRYDSRLRLHDCANNSQATTRRQRIAFAIWIAGSQDLFPLLRHIDKLELTAGPDPMPITSPVLPAPLRDGDRLTSDEFMRRWEAMPDVKHAELIDGIVYMSSPVSRKHSDFDAPLTGWLANYVAATPGCRVGSEGTWLMGERNVPQPDNTLRILPEYGGQSRDEGEYSAGAPELIVEVAVSSRARDLGVKLKLYERMGVREYLIAVVAKRQFLWNELTANGYQAVEPDADGIFRSRCFPGLWLDPAALWGIDLAALFAVLQQGLATCEHAAFMAGLAKTSDHN